MSLGLGGAAIGGVLPGVLTLTDLRCVLGLVARTHGLVGFVGVVMGVGSGCSPDRPWGAPSVAPSVALSVATLCSSCSFLPVVANDFMIVLRGRCLCFLVTP